MRPNPSLKRSTNVEASYSAPMNPWAVNPAWQNFSSLVREAATADSCRTGMPPDPTPLQCKTLANQEAPL